MRKWTYETVREEASKYTSRKQFQTNNQSAYTVARKNGWIDEFSDLFGYKKQFRWTYGNCFEEAKKYKSRSEFQKGAGGAYTVARKNGWLDNFSWLKNESFDLYKDPVDCVYVYEFEEQNCAYVGRTLMRRRKEREYEHIFCPNKDAVAKYAEENSLSVPIPKYLEENLTLSEGVEREGFWENWYRENGWCMLNKAKTGSIGGLDKGKWNYEKCYNEAKKYCNINDFHNNSSSAYNVAYKRGWLTDYNWLTYQRVPNNYWTYERCWEEASKYKSRGEFQYGNGSAYARARKKGWLEKFDWLEKVEKVPNGYWNNYAICKEEAKKYKSRGEFKTNTSAYNAARRNGWLEEFFGKSLLKSWTYETCKEEAKLYSSRTQFHDENQSAYNAARRNDWLDEFFPKDVAIKEANDAFNQMLKSKEGKKAIEMIRKDIKNITI